MYVRVQSKINSLLNRLIEDYCLAENGFNADLLGIDWIRLLWYSALAHMLCQQRKLHLVPPSYLDTTSSHVWVKRCLNVRRRAK